MRKCLRKREKIVRGYHTLLIHCGEDCCDCKPMLFNKTNSRQKLSFIANLLRKIIAPINKRKLGRDYHLLRKNISKILLRLTFNVI